MVTHLQIKSGLVQSPDNAATIIGELSPIPIVRQMNVSDGSGIIYDWRTAIVVGFFICRKVDANKPDEFIVWIGYRSPVERPGFLSRWRKPTVGAKPTRSTKFYDTFGRDS